MHHAVGYSKIGDFQIKRTHEWYHYKTESYAAIYAVYLYILLFQRDTDPELSISLYMVDK